MQIELIQDIKVVNNTFHFIALKMLLQSLTIIRKIHKKLRNFYQTYKNLNQIEIAIKEKNINFD